MATRGVRARPARGTTSSKLAWRAERVGTASATGAGVCATAVALGTTERGEMEGALTAIAE